MAVDGRAGGEVGAAFDGRTDGVALFVALNVAHANPYSGGRVPAVRVGAVWHRLMLVVEVWIFAAQPPHREVVAFTKPCAFVPIRGRGRMRRVGKVVRVTAVAPLVGREWVVCVVAFGRLIAPAPCSAVRPHRSAWARLGSSLGKHCEQSSEQVGTPTLVATPWSVTVGCISYALQVRHV